MAQILDANHPKTITRAAACLRAGRLVVFPTDTVYGVGANAFDPAAIDRLYRAKIRPRDKGIPVLLADYEHLALVVREIPPAAAALITRFWPGPLSLVLPRQSTLAANLAPDDGVAVRIPDHPLARAVIRAAGGAVATSSANRSGDPPATTAGEAQAALGQVVALVLDGGPSATQASSTVVDCRGPTLRLLRSGPIDATELASAGPIAL